MELPNASLSTDALPMAPRQPTDTVNIAPSTETAQPTNADNPVSQADSTEDFDEIPEPHPDWQFNIFLDNIAEGITSEVFEKMKHLFRGPGGISDTTLNEMRSALDLFSIMRTRRLLTRDNLIYLQAILYRLGRVDLTKQGVEYANTIGNVIHFYPASALPENGFKYVKLHVEGRNFRNCTRAYVQNIRNRVAAILFIPLEFVIIAGLEPSTSLLITLMIPDSYVTILEELLDTGACNVEFTELGIDIVKINKVYNVGDFMDRETLDIDQQPKLASIYQQFEAKSKQLEVSEVERLRLSGEIAKNKKQVAELETKHFHDDVMIRTLKTVVSDDHLCLASLSSQCALTEFESAIKQVSTCDKNVLRRLISANSAVVANRLNDSYRIRQKQLELAVEDLQSQIIPLKLQVHKYRFFSEVTVEEMDKILLDSFRKLLQSFAEEVSVGVEINAEALQILKKISRSLRCREKEKLANKYVWDPNDKLKQTIDNDQSFFLAGILYKEIKETQTIVDMEQFISQCLEDVGRTDLMKKFQDLVKGMTRNSAKSKGKRNTSQRKRSGSLPRTASKGDNSEHDDTFQLLNKVANQVQTILDTMHVTKKSFASEFGPVKDLGISVDPPPYSRYPCFF
ncbi:uncharacterized protein LOC123552421 [Mercenaria mercenaria]|uniref:uncharacterized protein LOC123552421 n=1 Tax=Mercenaria mercenaria TaxID=6596 RepID=UPI00234E9943|nr:uncharacterized protein LOC123552421 [Mercenaria mercenaria]XP_053397906.1 uncharacterized protein LOC123552421 [Mercenaria mercenaria]